MILSLLLLALAALLMIFLIAIPVGRFFSLATGPPSESTVSHTRLLCMYESPGYYRQPNTTAKTIGKGAGAGGIPD
jgi:hypothetical protein